MTATADRQMELTLPMVPDIEIAAARAVANLAREMGMSSEHVDEMTHAVIEACINAREHSGCADNRIYLRFLGTSANDGNRIDIWVTDHGKGFDPQEVRAYLQLIAEEIERLVKDVDRLARENAMLRDDLDDHNQRERILKDTLLSAQKVSEEVKSNARKEAELIVKDAELLSERLVSQAMSRVADLERTIQDLKVERRGARNKLEATLDTIQQLLMLDAEQEANELPITSMHRLRE